MQRTRNYNKGGEGASWGAPTPAAQQQQQGEVQYQSAEEVMEEARDEAYHMDTTGLSTTNFAPPPRLSAAPNANTDPNTSARATPAPPPRVTGGYTKPAPSSFAPPPSGVAATSRAARPVPTPPPRLPARQNSNPNEYTPAPPPSYTAVVEEPEVAQPQQARGMAGGSAAAQVNELQARFARMNPGAGEAVGDVAGQAAMKKKPPPPPVKKAGLAATAGGDGHGQGGTGGTPPPVPLGSRPKF